MCLGSLMGSVQGGLLLGEDGRSAVGAFCWGKGSFFKEEEEGLLSGQGKRRVQKRVLKGLGWDQLKGSLLGSARVRF